MTREEAIEAIQAISERYSRAEKYLYDGETEGADIILDDEDLEALDMAISALSENKGDLISRQAVLDELEKWDWQDLYLPSHFKQILDDVPSVENKGEWILYGYVSTKQIKNCTERYCCSKCHNIISRDFRYFKYCPNCGADMREPKGEKGTS